MPLWFDNTSKLNKEKLHCDWCYVPHKNTFWVVWQTLLSFLIPLLTIFSCWVVMIYLFLTQEMNSVLKLVTTKAMCVTGFFLICASPFCIVFFMEGFHLQKDNRLQKMTMPLVLVNSVIQPFLYILINSQLRGRLFRLVCRKKTEEDPLTEVTEATPKIADINKADHERGLFQSREVFLIEVSNWAGAGFGTTIVVIGNFLEREKKISYLYC